MRRARRAARVDVVDDTFVVAPPAAVAVVLRDPALWRAWWPELGLEVDETRGVEGTRWHVVAGPVRGTAEIWLEPWRDGVIIHWYLRATPCGDRIPDPPGTVGDRWVAAAVAHYKDCVHAFKDHVEAGRRAGVPPEYADR